MSDKKIKTVMSCKSSDPDLVCIQRGKREREFLRGLGEGGVVGILALGKSP